MGLGYQIAYAIGVTPWERAGDAGAEQLNRWLEKEEAHRGGPGRALDLGCGSGAHSVTLADAAGGSPVSTRSAERSHEHAIAPTSRAQR